jgi:hypothetical protein
VRSISWKLAVHESNIMVAVEGPWISETLLPSILVVNDVILLTLERSLALGFMGFWSISKTAYKKLI